MGKLWRNDVDELYVLLRRARLAWAEKATDDSDCALELADEEAARIIELIETTRRARKAKATRWDSPIGVRPEKVV